MMSRCSIWWNKIVLWLYSNWRWPFKFPYSLTFSLNIWFASLKTSHIQPPRHANNAKWWWVIKDKSSQENKDQEAVQRLKRRMQQTTIQSTLSTYEWIKGQWAILKIQKKQKVVGNITHNKNQLNTSVSYFTHSTIQQTEAHKFQIIFAEHWRLCCLVDTICSGRATKKVHCTRYVFASFCFDFFLFVHVKEESFASEERSKQNRERRTHTHNIQRQCWWCWRY